MRVIWFLMFLLRRWGKVGLGMLKGGKWQSSVLHCIGGAKDEGEIDGLLLL